MNFKLKYEMYICISFTKIDFRICYERNVNTIRKHTWACLSVAYSPFGAITRTKESAVGWWWVIT